MGEYLATFGKPVSGCSYQATIGRGDSSYTDWGEIMVALVDKNPAAGISISTAAKSLKVRTAAVGTSTLKDRDFQLALFCPS
jgi:hypothetical protein